MTVPIGKAIDSEALLDSGAWTLYQKLLTALVAFAVIVDGFDIQVLALALPSLSREWHLARAAFAPVLALGLAGMVVGAPFFGYIGDRLGRRKALIGAVAVFAAATLSTAAIGSLGALAVLRFLAGVGAGGALPAASAFTAELAPIARRAMAVKLTIVCVPLGGMIAGYIAALILPAFGWKALYLVGGAAPAILVFLLLALLPESPRFLAQSESGWASLRSFLERIGHSLPAGCGFVIPARAENRGSIAELFAPEFFRDTLGLWIAFFFCLGGIYTIFSWLPALLTATGLSVAAAASGLGTFNLGGVIGVLIFTALIAVGGSRGTVLAGAALGAASALLILAVPAGRQDLLMGAVGLNGLLTNAVQTALYAMGAHIYPTRVRALGIACAAAMGRVGGIIGSLYGSALIAAGVPVFWEVLGAAMAVSFFGLIIVRKHIPAPARLEAELKVSAAGTI